MSLSVPCCDTTVTLTPLPVLHSIVDTLRKVLHEFKPILNDSFQDIAIFVSFPCFSDLTIRDMTSEPTLQQLITQSDQATANAIASTLTARTTFISLPPSMNETQKMPTTLSPFSDAP